MLKRPGLSGPRKHFATNFLDNFKRATFIVGLQKAMSCLKARTVTAIIVLVGIQLCAQVTLVNDTWRDWYRYDPFPPVYSEMGVDSDGDGDLESMWAQGGSGDLYGTNVAGRTVLRGTVSATYSSSWTTYFTTPENPVTLGDVGNSIIVTWQFSLSGVNMSNASQGFRLAVVKTPDGYRRSWYGSPLATAYQGYAMLGNMGRALGHVTSFGLYEWNTTEGELLAHSANWALLAKDESAIRGASGYADSTSYTFQFTATRTASDSLLIQMTMEGGWLGGDGRLEVFYEDTTPNTWTFDTFAIRPSRGDQTAAIFDSLLFRVQVIPEPTTGSLMFTALVLTGFVMRLRKRNCQ